jgi:hypothetical protein
MTGRDDADSDDVREPDEPVIREPQHGTTKGQNTTQYRVDESDPREER